MKSKKNKVRKIMVKLGTDHSTKTWIFKVILFSLFIILGLRMFFLQNIQYDKFLRMAEENRIKQKRIEPERGKIYDKNGKLLATNATGYRLLYLNERKYTDEQVSRIAQLTGYSKEVVEKRIKIGEITPYTRENIIFESLPEDVAHKLMEKIEENDYLELEMYNKRRYVFDEFASHVIGYVKKISNKEYDKLKEIGYSQRDVIGKDGIEQEYDKILKGEAGFERIEVNAYNKVQKRIDKESPTQGSDIYLTIEYELQEYMERVLRDNKYTGSFIALDPKTGKVLAMISYPTYSLNIFSTQIPQDIWDKIRNDPRRPMNNKSIAGEYPPGSIFKPITAFSYLEKGVNPYTTYYDPGFYEIGKVRWKSWKPGGHGYVDMKKSIIESANPYYYQFADKFGYKGIYDYAKKFGLGEVTGIDLAGERKGVVPSPEWKKKVVKENWYSGDSINMSIGQGFVLVTPLQMAQAYAVLANRGVAYKPRLVDKIIENGVPKELDREIALKIDLPKSYYDLMSDALRRTVSDKNGTTTIMRTDGVDIAAKSGSAQNSQSKETHAWVAGFFPVNNPEIVFVALLEGAGGGGKIAGGVAKKFVDKYRELKYGIPNPSDPKIDEELIEENGQIIGKPISNSNLNSNRTTVTAPNVKKVSTETTEVKIEEKTPSVQDEVVNNEGDTEKNN